MNIIPTHSTTSITSVIDRFPGLRSVIVESERLAQPATILEGARMLGDPLDDEDVPDLIEAHDSDDEFSDLDEDNEECSVPLPRHGLYEPPSSIHLQPSGGMYVSNEDVVMGDILEDAREAKVSSCTDDEKKTGSGLPEAYQKTVKELAQNVASDTKSTYKSIIKKAEKFFQDHKILKPGQEFICKDPRVDAPQLAVLAIMHSCDDTNLDGTKKSPDELRSSYSHAEKQRAAFRFGYEQHGLMDTWRESEVTGKMLGNPMTSPVVSKYMSGLKRRKVQSGETPTSSRAITEEDIRLMYNVTRAPIQEVKSIPSKPRKDRNPSDWGGHRLFRQVHFIYVISFICLLRIDEALKIRANDIDISYDKHGILMTLTLPFRKTHQFGDIKPFHLREFPEELKHLCPVRAYMEWVGVSGIEEGYLCRRVQANDMIHGEEPMSSQQFLTHFRNHLYDIGHDAMQYGGHSFRRGGCQWLHIERRWPLRKICEWGGWSQEFSNLTIVKYLISWNDNPMFKRENFFLMNQQAEVACATCGRKCLCYGSIPTIKL